MGLASRYFPPGGPACGRAGQGRRAQRGAAGRLRRRAGLAAPGQRRRAPGGAPGAARQRHGGGRSDQVVPERRGHRSWPGDRAGSIVAVYTRCSGGLFHERCSIYQLDLASGREHRVSALATRRASITEPSVWAGRYAFGRVAIEGRERAGRNFGLYTGVRRAKRLGRAAPAVPTSTPTSSPTRAGRPATASSTTRSASTACAAGPTASSPSAPSASRRATTTR